MIWLAHAKDGEWTSGPTVCSTLDMARKYQETGRRVEGPYVDSAKLVSVIEEYGRDLPTAQQDVLVKLINLLADKAELNHL